MGMIITPTPFGDDCIKCYPPGETPAKFKCFFGGISMGGDWHDGIPYPPDGFYNLYQSDISPCVWYSNDDKWNISLLWMTGYSLLDCVAKTAEVAFSNVPNFECVKFFSSIISEPPNKFYYGGYGYITTPEGVAAAVNRIVPVFEDGARFEVTPSAGGLIGIRYANVKHNQNIIVQVPAD